MSVVLLLHVESLFTTGTLARIDIFDARHTLFFFYKINRSLSTHLALLVLIGVWITPLKAAHLVQSDHQCIL